MPLLFSGGDVMAGIGLPHFFSDHMVLQRDRNVAIWGTASPGAAVTVAFKDATTSVKADADGPWRADIWHWADATISGIDTVKVSSKQVASPVAVRYAWAANPAGANLVNSAGLPASVLRTDTWDDVEVEVDLSLQQRRALAMEIKALAAKKAKLDRGSEEFKAIAEKAARAAEGTQSIVSTGKVSF
jgi:hypothetical protein